jgi:hypothetical protein
MTGFQIKILACLFMLVDHIGLIFFPYNPIFRIIGRLAFPIFAFLIAEGYAKTSNIKFYFLRLTAFGLISQPIFQLVVKTGELNIFLTLSLGLLSILLFDKIKNKSLSWLSIILAATAAHFLNFSYGAYGILSIFFFWFYGGKEKFSQLFIIQGIIIFFYLFIEKLSLVNGALVITPPNFIQSFSIFALFFIYLYNGKRGRKLKYFFYVFYPAHLLTLFFIKYFAQYQ